MAKHSRFTPPQGPAPVPVSSQLAPKELDPTSLPVDPVLTPALPPQASSLPDQLPPIHSEVPEEDEDEEEEDDDMDNVLQSPSVAPEEVVEVVQNDPRRMIRKQLRHLYHMPGGKPLPETKGPFVTHAKNLKNA